MKPFILSVFFLLTMILISNAQPGFPYDERWKKVEQLVQEQGLTESALTEVQKIYEAAKKENNQPQLIKALVYRINLQQEKEEDAELKGIQALEQELQQSKGVVYSLLTNILAEAYWQFLQNNRWKFYNRTNTTQFQKEDPQTWTIDDFHNRIAALYQASLQEPQLKQTKLEQFEPVIRKGNARHLRPTLFDLLAHRALAYYENDERTINRPSYAFVLNQPAAFDPAADFIHLTFPTNDSASLHHKAVLLYQEIIAFHLNDTKPDALIDADLKRIAFVYEHAVTADKTKRYRQALQYLLTRYNNKPIVAQAGYLLASDYANYASTYDFNKHKVEDAENPRWYYKKAMEVCNIFTSQEELSEGRANCHNLLLQIRERQLSLQSETVNLPGQPFRTLVSYRNTGRLWFRVLRLEKDVQEDKWNYWEEDYWNQLAKQTYVQQFSYDMPATEDYQPHRTEVKIPALPAGTYLILASADERFTTADNLLAVHKIHVSTISWIANGNTFFVLHRESGQPLSRAFVQVWKQEYNYNQSRYTYTKAEQYTTDATGRFRMSENNGNYHSKRLEIRFEKERLFLDDNVYHYTWNPESKVTDEEKNRRVFLFTDRSIYRPGQTLYFKGIITTTDVQTQLPKVVSNTKTVITLWDANQQKVDSLVVTSNEYGSYAGQFTIPSGGMNGNYHLTETAAHNSYYFSVEEYKRPKFYVEYKPVTGSFRVNDTVRITGVARAYAGNNIDQARVKYRVVREPRLLYPWLSYRWGWPPLNSQEIANGEVQTNAEGAFEISFQALPDLQVRTELNPVFDYKIIADVTDLNGETRSGETVVSVGTKALQLEIGLPAGTTMAVDSIKYLNISTTNMMGVFEQALVTVTLHRLEAPTRLIRSRYWAEPDQFVLTAAEYRKDFPFDEYSNESRKESWKRLEQVFMRTDSSLPHQRFLLTGLKLKPGWYLVEARTKDKDGQEVINQTYLQLVDSKTQQPAAPEWVWNQPNTLRKQPGETAQVEFSSSAGELFLLQQEDQDFSKEPVYSVHTIRGTYRLQVPITERNRGGLAYAFSFVKYNRTYTVWRTIAVPWNNKELTITYETFRNKTLPGSKEEWKVKISGAKGERVAAELLTSMYDASLDQFKPHQWQAPSLFSNNHPRNNWQAGGFTISRSRDRNFTSVNWEEFQKAYDELTSTIAGVGYIGKMLQGRVAGVEVLAAPTQDSQEVKREEGTGTLTTVNQTKKEQEQTTKTEPTGDLQIRKNFRETAFFFPQLQTDTAGSIILSFTMPEALTRWKWQLLAHTPDLSTGSWQQEVVTQKELMVQPFAPRFLREGDSFEFTAKISNLSGKEITGQSMLQLLNTSTGQPVDGWFQNMFPVQYFNVAAGQSTVVRFRTTVPYNFNEALTYRIIAKGAPVGGMTAAISDGEEATVPVLTNRMLVTESLPLTLQGSGTKSYQMPKLIQSGSSQTLTHHKLTVEFTSNPAWYAVQALPYLMEYPYECAEQTWNRFYANALASHITGKLPRIRQVLEQWKLKDTSAFLSNLQKNEELKQVLLAETPWVLQGRSEEQQKKQIALLFDLVRMSAELNKQLQQLKEMQASNGGFVWFKGGPDDRYITQYIVAGMGHLLKLQAVPEAQKQLYWSLLQNALPYLDRKLQEDFEQLKRNKIKLKQNNLGVLQIHYLYMRSFFPEIPLTKGTEAAYQYYLKQSQQYWLKQGRYQQGMIALFLHRNKQPKAAAAIVKSLKENALYHEEMGMYWKEFNSGYYWYQSPVEAQALLIEVFSEVVNDRASVAALKTWLLKQKQTQNWKTTKATAEACYALLLQGDDWLAAEPEIEIKTGSTVFNSTTEKTEAGTGYFKRSIDGAFVKPDMGNISLKVSTGSNPSTAPTWGAVYWQYFENLDQITPATTPLQLSKKYFVEENTSTGPVLTPVAEGTNLRVGDKIKVRIELKVDRTMEYVHMKDMRPSCLEPVNVLSSYKWQDGLGYYESTKDASTNFFFGWLPRGTYVFEYTLFVTHAGNYSSGITTIQCMYAPEFSSHSEGVRMKVKE